MHLFLRQLAQKIGHTPSEQDYKKHYSSIEGAPTPSQLRHEFGTWTAAVKGAGLTPLPTAPPRNDIPNESLIADFVGVAAFRRRLALSDDGFAKQKAS